MALESSGMGLVGSGLILVACCLQTARAKGFFEDNPYIVNLDVNNFPQRMNNDTWLVNFYAPWCPHCVHFAPSWKQMAAQCATSENINIGAVDCVANRQLCKDQKIGGFPTVKEYKMGSEGHKNASGPQGVKLTIKFEKLKKLMNAKCPHLHLEAGIATSPSVGPAPPSEAQREELNKNSENKSLPSSSSSSFSAPLAGDVSPGSASKPKSDAASSIEPDQKLDIHLRVMDALAAVVYSFDNVIFSTRTTFTQTDLQALSEFVHVLCASFPLKSNREAFQSLRDKFATFFSAKEPETSTFERIWKEWKINEGVNILSEIRSMYSSDTLSPDLPGEKAVSTGSDIVAASQPNFRTCQGYTCALWRLFHLLSMNCGMGAPFPTPRQCFLGIHSFVTVFFNCDICRTHFNTMYPRSTKRLFLDANPDTPEVHKNEVALWVWHAHNRVNTRLAPYKRMSAPVTTEKGSTSTGVGAMNSDQSNIDAHSAIHDALWPPVAVCRQCRGAAGEAEEQKNKNSAAASSLVRFTGPASKDLSGVTWREPVVLAFLHEFYCHPADLDGCAQILTWSKTFSWSLLTVIAFAAKAFLVVVLTGSIILLFVYRNFVFLTIKWAVGLVSDYFSEFVSIGRSRKIFRTFQKRSRSNSGTGSSGGRWGNTKLSSRRMTDNFLTS